VNGPIDQGEPPSKAARSRLDRLHEHRERKAKGLTLLRVEADMGRVADLLFDEGLLPEDVLEDRAEVEKALAKFICARIVVAEDS
jgi:hypothetical protein